MQISRKTPKLKYTALLQVVLGAVAFSKAVPGVEKPGVEEYEGQNKTPKQSSRSSLNFEVNGCYQGRGYLGARVWFLVLSSLVVSVVLPEVKLAANHSTTM